LCNFTGTTTNITEAEKDIFIPRFSIEFGVWMSAVDDSGLFKYIDNELLQDVYREGDDAIRASLKVHRLKLMKL
jgi:hypothetical protein